MKTTNDEISKKLAEIGFEAENDFYWVKWNEGLPELVYKSEIMPALIEKVPAYDLETLFNALPTSIEKNGKVYLRFLHHNVLGYYATSNKLDYGNIRLWDNIFELYNHSKSLADTAGRLLIKLFEAGIINFKK